MFRAVLGIRKQFSSYHHYLGLLLHYYQVELQKVKIMAMIDKKWRRNRKFEKGNYLIKQSGHLAIEFGSH